MAVEQRDLPRGWVWTTIGDLTENAERVDPTLSPHQKFTYLDISGIDNSRQKIGEPKSFAGSVAPSRARQLIKTGDILFSTVRPYLKNIALVPDQYDGQIASTGFCVLRPVNTTLSKYLFYYVLTDRFLDELGELQRGSSYPAVRDNDVREQRIPLAPLNEQRRIVAQIETLLTQIDAGVQALKRAQVRLKRYKASVLQAAVEGRLVATEAELAEAEGRSYEPASALLERVREQRRQKFVDAQRRLLQVQIDLIAGTNTFVTPMVFLTAWLQEMALNNVDTTHIALINSLREDFFAQVQLKASRDVFTAQWREWHKRAVEQLQAQGVASQVLMNPRDVRVNQSPNSLSGILGELNAEEPLQRDSLIDLQKRWLIESAEAKWREAEERLAKPDVANLPRLPKGWIWVTLDQVGEVSGGITKNSNRDTLPFQLPYLRVANVYANRLALDNIQLIGATTMEVNRTKLVKDDLLVVEGNGSPEQIGRVALWDDSIETCLHQNHIIKVRLSNQTFPSYALYWMLSPDGRNTITNLASSSSGLYTLSLSKVASIAMPLPPFEEQKRITNVLCEKTLTTQTQ